MPPIQPSFLDAYEKYSSTHVEIPTLYYRWAARLAVSATLGKRVWVTRGHFRIYPNLYVLLIGGPGTGKGVTCGILQTIMQLSGYTAFAADRSTKEKFLTDLADGFNFRMESSESFDRLWQEDDSAPEPRECFILAEEFNDFIGLNNFEFIGLLTKLWSYSGVYSNRLKTGRSVEIFEPCLNLFGGNTHAGFTMAFPPEVMGQGFLARMLLVYGESTGKRVTFPPPPDEKQRTELAQSLSKLKYFHQGEMILGDATRSLLDEINQTWRGFDDDLRFAHYGTRRFTQFVKLCIVEAAAENSPEVSVDHVLRANTLLLDTEALMPKALGEFGKSRNAEVNSKIMQALHETTKPLNVKTLWKLVSNDLESPADLAKVLQGLQEADKILHTKEGGGGFLPKNPIRIQNERHKLPPKNP